MQFKAFCKQLNTLDKHRYVLDIIFFLAFMKITQHILKQQGCCTARLPHIRTQCTCIISHNFEYFCTFLAILNIRVEHVYNICTIFALKLCIFGIFLLYNTCCNTTRGTTGGVVGGVAAAAARGRWRSSRRQPAVAM